MQNLMDSVVKVVKADGRVFTDGKLLKNKLTELALKLDTKLIESLLTDAVISKVFFVQGDTKKGKFLVFDRDKFISFVNNKEFLPDSFTCFKNRIGLIANSEYIKEKGDVVLAWPYKDCILEGGQDKEEQKRSEIFYNEILAPDEIDRLFDVKTLINFKRIDASGEHALKAFFPTDNLIVKGNNLLALHSLENKFLGQIKLIYIDPPFNRKADTFYNDKFKHSSWLTFMRNRLDVAKALLRPDGFICLHLDDSELHYCKVLMDEIFKPENYRNTIAVKTNDPSGFKATSESLFSTANYILLYSKGEVKTKIPKVYIESEYDTMYSKVLLNKSAPYQKWKWADIGDMVAKEKGFESKKKAKENLGGNFENLIAEYALKHADCVFRTAALRGGARAKRIKTIEKSLANKGQVLTHPNDDVADFYILNGEGIVFYENKVIEINGERMPGHLLTDMWTDISWNGIAKEGDVVLKNGKKPERLLQRVIDMFSSKGDIILDYHLGSGTTCAVAHKMGRRYIGVEQLDYAENDAVVRLKNVIAGDPTGISHLENWKGGGSFVYLELKEQNEFYIAEVKKTGTTKDLGDIYKKIKKEAFFRYEIDVSGFEEKEFSRLSLKEQKQVLLECLDKNHLYLNYSEIEDSTFKIPAETKKLNKEFYGY